VIIQKLFSIDPIKNSSESVVIGILNLYTGSRSPADRLLLSVLQSIEKERSLSLISSSETWNAFRNSWSRFHVDAISSSLQAPMVLIDTHLTRINTFGFNTVADDPPSPAAFRGLQAASRNYDPNFWLPIIGYCLEKVEHSSELLLLIEIYAIGYTTVCLSAEQEVTRKMAASILITFDNLCQVR
jgi:hypothetical protein